MIISGLLDLIFSLVLGFLNFLSFPSIPNDYINSFHSFIDTISQGFSVLAYFCDHTAVIPIFLLTFSLEVCYRLYGLIMWIWHKLPISSE